jgi:hypothetical protein
MPQQKMWVMTRASARGEDRPPSPEPPQGATDSFEDDDDDDDEDEDDSRCRTSAKDHIPLSHPSPNDAAFALDNAEVMS